MKPFVLVVNNDHDRGQEIVRRLSAKYACRHAAGMLDVMRAMSEQRWAAIIVRYGLGDETSGLEILQVANEALPGTFRLIYSDARSPSFHHDSVRLLNAHFTGASATPDFLDSLEKALDELTEPPSLTMPADLRPILDDVLTARAPSSRKLLTLLHEAAERDAPAYVYGEPGSGVTRAAYMLRRWRREWKSGGSPGVRPGLQPVSILRVPPLRERPQDLPELIMRILLQVAQQAQEPQHRISEEAVQDLLKRPWYGNVVELSGVIYRATQRVGPGKLIRVEDLPQDSQPAWRPSQFAKDEGQRDCVLRQLRAARNVSAAARFEGCSRANYIRMMRRLGIVRADVPEEPRASRTPAGDTGRS
jgi:DNA-binding NtrC family response regulator